MHSGSVAVFWQHGSNTTATCVSVVAGDVTNIAEALGVPDRGRRVAAWMSSIVRSVAQTVADLTGGSATGSKPRVALLEWIDPIMGSGHWCACFFPCCRTCPACASPAALLELSSANGAVCFTGPEQPCSNAVSTVGRMN